jgi:hypothetical protein
MASKFKRLAFGPKSYLWGPVQFTGAIHDYRAVEHNLARLVAKEKLIPVGETDEARQLREEWVAAYSRAIRANRERELQAADA